jgi:hypothetical protein
MLVGEIRQSYLLNRSSRADLIDLYAMSPAESLKSVLATIWVPITTMSTDGGALRGSADGLRPRAERSETWRKG